MSRREPWTGGRGAAGALGGAALLFVMLLAGGGAWPYGIRVVVAAAGLLFLAAAQGLAGFACLSSPSPLKGLAVALLAIGAVATLMMTPFGAMALATWRP